MAFEWDSAKAARNLAKHGIDFEDAAKALIGLALLSESRRDDEDRYTSVAELEGRVIVVVWTPREGALRLISARRANERERQAHHQAIRERAPVGKD